ncbi:MAG: flavin reductase family protein [Myxococcota bacterium]
MDDTDEGAVDAIRFKQALRRWCSGVTVVTSRGEAGIHGMTVSAFSSVSASPPLILVCCNRDSNTHTFIEESGVFGVNILAAGQEALSNGFADPRRVDRFEGVAWSPGPKTGSPILDGVAAWFDCRTRSAHREGSHTIYVGDVLELHTRDAAPLLYHDGGYASLG